MGCGSSVDKKEDMSQNEPTKQPAAGGGGGGDGVEPDPEEIARMKRMQGRGRRLSVSAEVDNSNDTYEPVVVPKTDEQIARIRSSMKDNFLFATLDDAQFKTIVDVMKEVTVSAGDSVIKQGGAADNFYVIDSGEFDVYVRNANDGKPVLHYVPGQSFGELALMYGCPRAATVTAVTDAVLWAVDRHAFKHIIVDATKKKREKYESWLASIPLLSSCNVFDIGQIADAVNPKTYKNGEVIIQAGDTNYEQMFLYFIEEGTCSAEKLNGDVLSTLRPTQYFGEVSLLRTVPRTCNVVAKGDVKVAALDSAIFNRMLTDLCGDAMMEHMKTYTM